MMEKVQEERLDGIDIPGFDEIAVDKGQIYEGGHGAPISMIMSRINRSISCSFEALMIAIRAITIKGLDHALPVPQETRIAPPR